MSSTSTVLADVPLFPLHTVLFPDGILPLKIFEARYLDMARDCLREKTPFGVLDHPDTDSILDAACSKAARRSHGKTNLRCPNQSAVSPKSTNATSRPSACC